MGKYGKEGGYLATMRMPWIGKVPEFCHKFDAGCPVAVPSWHSAMWNIITGQGLTVVNDILEYCSQNIFQNTRISKSKTLQLERAGYAVGTWRQWMAFCTAENGLCLTPTMLTQDSTTIP